MKDIMLQTRERKNTRRFVAVLIAVTAIVGRADLWGNCGLLQIAR